MDHNHCAWIHSAYNKIYLLACLTDTFSVYCRFTWPTQLAMEVLVWKFRLGCCCCCYFSISWLGRGEGLSSLKNLPSIAFK